MSSPSPTVSPFSARTLAEATDGLRAPFAPELVLWRPKKEKGDRGNLVFGETVEVVPYLNRALVIDRLNLVVPGLWSARYELAGSTDAGSMMWCLLTIDGDTRPDVGVGEGKGLVSDALKRAAGMFGVGVSLGAVPPLLFNVGDTDRYKLKRLSEGHVMLTELGRSKCEQHYRAWLDRVGTAAYGPVLGHGAPDARGTIRGDSRADEAEQWASAHPEPVEHHASEQTPAAAAHVPTGVGDPVLARESKIHLLHELADKVGTERPEIADSISDENLDALLDTYEVLAAQDVAA